MAIRRNTFNGGTSGAGLSTSNSGGVSGDAFSAVESTLTFSSEQARDGSLSVKAPSASGSGYGRWSVSGDRTAATRMYLYMTAAVSTSNGDFITGRVDINGGAVVISNMITSSSPSQRLRLRSTASANIWTSSSTLPLNQWVRVEMLVNIGSGASDGQARIAYYVGESATAIEDSGWVTGLNLGGDIGTIDNVRFGKSSSGTLDGAAYFDTIGLNTGSDYSGFIGPEAAQSTAPTAQAGTSQIGVAAGSTVSLNGSASTNATAYSWAFIYPSSGAPSLSGANTATPSFTAGPTGAIYAIRLTASNSGQTDTDIVNVAVGSGASSGGATSALVWTGSQWS